ncbi:MAG: diguanylate cyclase [Clostridia bacterium]|nr:diguanylate cyclase [Clostridia bacterium]
MIQDIYIIDNTQSVLNVLKQIFKEEVDYQFKSVKTEELNIALTNIPDMIIIDEDTIDMDIVDLCKSIRANEDNSITPIIVISSIWEKEHRVKILQQSIEYFILKPVDREYLYFTVKNLLRLLQTNRRISPLTGLPGNVQIQAEMKKRLLNRERFAVFYFDLDNFKAYNDIYGFSNGDEIIKFTARTIVKNIHSLGLDNSFIGHIGGDDFIAITSVTNFDKICNNIIVDFDTNVLDFYNEEDIKKGYIEVANRRGIIEQFPLTSISIGVVEIDAGRFKNTLEIGEVGAQVKHQAKSVMGSTYVINRRKR